MEYQNLIFQKTDGVATIKMNRPKSYNALDFGLADDLVKALESCADDVETRAVILTGEGKAFCSGGDLALFQGYLETDPSEPFRQLTKRLNRIVMDLRLLPKPVIAAINGPAAGAGFSLAAACDLRIAAASAVFRQAYTSVGLIPDGGFGLTVPLLVGFGRASELVLLDPVISAQQALELGLVNQVVEDSEIQRAAFEMAAKLAEGPTRAFALAKEVFNEAMLGLLERQLERERLGLVKAAKTRDFREGIQAFFEKRPPSFTGK